MTAFLAPISTYRPRKATSLTDDELDGLKLTLDSLPAEQAIVVSRQPHDTESKARTDATAVRKLFRARHAIILRTHVLGDTGAHVGAVSLPLDTTNATAEAVEAVEADTGTAEAVEAVEADTGTGRKSRKSS